MELWSNGRKRQSRIGSALDMDLDLGAQPAGGGLKIVNFRGWSYLRPFCWVSLIAQKWLARRLVRRRRRNPTKILGCSTQPTNKPWPMLEPSPKLHL